MPIKNFRQIKPHEDPTVYKDRILSELFLCGAVQEKIKGICFRNYINPSTHIQDDILQETFYHLCRTKAEQLIEMYEDDSSRLLGLSVRIAILKGVTKNKSNPDYPKHSVMTSILFASNLNHPQSLSVTDDIEENENAYCYVLIDPDSLPNATKDLFELINMELTDEEIEFLDEFVATKKSQRKKADKEKFAVLKEKIKSIVLKHKIIINSND
jgi:hypothetical protein